MGTPGASGTAAPLAGPSDWKLVSKGLERPGAQLTFDAQRSGDLVVASVLTEDKKDDYDAGLVFSTDAGKSWRWGGVVAAPGNTFPEAVMIVPNGAVIVGSTETTDALGKGTVGFVAKAIAPDYVPVALALPKDFTDGEIHLQDVAIVGGEWVIVGYTVTAGQAGAAGKPAGMLWRSSDEGATWSRQEVTAEGLTELALKSMAIAPDGSLNIVGQGGNGDVVRQYDAVWLRSTDAGRTFTMVSPKAMSGDFDQGATGIQFSAGGRAAIVGWDEVTDEHGAAVSALWISAPGHGVQRIGGPRIAVKGDVPPGEFLGGVVWDGEAPVAWGSAKGEYPMAEVQFWTLQGGALIATTTLDGDGTPLAIVRILSVRSEALALGQVGELAQSDVAVWQGTFGEPPVP
jgi:hypothetical protein